MNRKRIMSRFILASFVFFVAVVLIGVSIDAAYATGGGMPWEAPLKKVQDSVSGPVAMVVSVLAIVAVGITLIFGGDMQGFVRQLLYVTLVIGLIIMANTVIEKLYGKGASALITIVSTYSNYLHV